ncbi:MAG: hypothetical protein JWM56_402 [Candidatus Peribacteria bacterium]|nr:hypothetical protein [Candidatus Peribacteria bacterium]
MADASYVNPAAINTTEAPQQSAFAKWAGLFILSMALAIIIIDTTLLNVSLRVLIVDLHTDLQHLQWVISAYALMLAAFTITGGRLGDIFGKKKMFLTGAVIFAAGSFIASISTNFWQMLAGEAIIEGLGAALMMPATSSLLVTNFQGRERAIAFGVWGGIAAASSAVGPILGGFLTSHYSWRWGFRINVVVAAFVLIFSFLLHDSGNKGPRPSLDYLGVVLAGLGLTSIIYGIIESSTYGWWLAKQPFEMFGRTIVSGPISIVPLAIIFGFVVLAFFLSYEQYREESGKTPLVSLSIFKNHQFASGIFTSSVFSLGMAGIIFTLPVFLQTVHGLDAFSTGLTLLPMSLCMLVVAPLSGFFTKYVTPKRLIQTGLMVSVLAILIIRQSLNTTGISFLMQAGLALYGVGMGFIMAQITNITLSAVDIRMAGEASGLNNTLRQVGQSLGSAIVGSIIVGTFATAISTGVQTSSVIPIPAKTAVQAQMSKEAASLDFSGTAAGSIVSPVMKNELSAIVKASMTAADRRSLLYTAFFVFMGFLASFSLPGKRRQSAAAPVPAGH